MKVITNDHGLIKLDDKIIPGVYQSMTVNNSIKIDEVDIKGASGTSKQPQGYNDAKITLTLTIQKDKQNEITMDDVVKHFPGKTEQNVYEFMNNSQY